MEDKGVGSRLRSPLNYVDGPIAQSTPDPGIWGLHLSSLKPCAAGFQDEGSGGGDGGAGEGDVVEGLEVGFPRSGRGVATDVAALRVVEFDEGVFGQDGREAGRSGGTVAAGRDRRADEFGADASAVEVVEVDEKVVSPVAVDVAGEHDGVGDFSIGEEFYEAAAVHLVARPL